MIVPGYLSATSLGATFNGGWVKLGPFAVSIGFQVKWTGNAGAAVGSFGFDITNDTAPDTSNPLSFTTLTLPSGMTVAAASPASNDSSFFFDFTFAPNAAFMRLTYTRTSGTGTVSVGYATIEGAL